MSQQPNDPGKLTRTLDSHERRLTRLEMVYYGSDELGVTPIVVGTANANRRANTSLILGVISLCLNTINMGLLLFLISYLF